MSDTDSFSDDKLARNLARYSLLIEKISTISQVTKLQNVINADHADTTRRLNNIIRDSHVQHNSHIRKLELQRTDLITTLTEFHNSLSKVNTSNQRAKSIHEDIETTDREHTYLKETLNFLNSIRTLKNNITLTQGALEESDYFVAATAINEINQLPRNIIASQYAQAIIPTAELPYSVVELLEMWTTQLRDLFKEKFNTAVINNDINTLTTFFKLFPLIGEPTLGLDLYSKYITDMISQENQKFTIGAMKFDSGFDLVLLQLFKMASTVINEHSKIIDKAYGMEYMTIIMEKIEIEVELQSCLVLNFFKEKRLDLYTVNDLSNKSFINEFSNILQNWSMYARFFSVRWNEFNSIKSDSVTESETTELRLAPPIINGGFLRKLNEENIIDQFERITANYLQNSFKKSVTIEELPDLNDMITLTLIKHNDPSSWPISSVLEDLILLFRQVLISSVNTGQVEVIMNMLERLPSFIGTEFLAQYLQNKFKSLQEKLTTGTMVTLKRYIPKKPENERQDIVSSSPSITKLSQLQNNTNPTNANNQFRKFNIRGAFANIQSNLQSVVTTEENDEEATLALHHYLIYVNTLYFVIFATEKLLIQEIITENPRLLNDSFPFSNDATKIRENLNQCQSAISQDVKKLQNWSIKYLFQNICLPKVRNLMNELFTNGTENKYICGIDDFENVNKINEFTVKWDQFMIPFQNIMYTDAYYELLESITNFMKNLIEKRIWSLSVNELGAVKLDRELSLFISTVCGLHYSVREKFTRVTQIVLLLGFDDDDFDVSSGDVKEELATTISWILSPQERARTRELKVDKRR